MSDGVQNQICLTQVPIHPVFWGVLMTIPDGNPRENYKNRRWKSHLAINSPLAGPSSSSLKKAKMQIFIVSSDFIRRFVRWMLLFTDFADSPIHVMFPMSTGDSG